MNIKGIHIVMVALALALPRASVSAPLASLVQAGPEPGPPASAAGNKKPERNSAMPTPTNCDASPAKVAPRLVQWDPTRLESSPEVAKAAEAFVNQMVGNYELARQASKSDTPPAGFLIAGSEVPFINAVMSAAAARPDPGVAATNPEQMVKTCAAEVTTARTDKQTGAPSGSDGATSITELTGIPQLLSIAVENGAVMSNVSGTTMTLSTSLYGLLTGFVKIPDSSHDYRACPICVRLGASATFNVANASTPLTSATRKNVSQWQLKFSVRDQSTRSPKVNDLWDLRVGDRASALAAAARPLPGSAAEKYDQLTKDFDDFIAAHITDITACIQNIKKNASTCSFSSDLTDKQPASAAGLANLLLKALDSDKSENSFQNTAKTIPGDPAVAASAQKYQAALTAYNNAITQFEADVDNLAKGWNADFTFGQQFPTSTSSSPSRGATSGITGLIGSAAAATSSTHVPDYLVTGVDVSWQPKIIQPKDAGPGVMQTNKAPSTAKPSFTFNGKAGFYTNPNTALNEKTFRGLQVATQLQWTLGTSPFVSPSNGDKSKVTLSASGGYQRLSENKDQKGKRPDIASANVKLTIPFPGGISFPLAVAYANSQPQQAKGSYVIGNFGISFDADKLAALLALKH